MDKEQSKIRISLEGICTVLDEICLNIENGDIDLKYTKSMIAAVRNTLRNVD